MNILDILGRNKKIYADDYHPPRIIRKGGWHTRWICPCCDYTFGNNVSVCSKCGNLFDGNTWIFVSARLLDNESYGGDSKLFELGQRKIGENEILSHENRKNENEHDKERRGGICNYCGNDISNTTRGACPYCGGPIRRL